MTYKERIAAHLRACLRAGLTQAELARKLGFKHSNVISMHLDPANGISPFPLKRLPALAAQCHLAAGDVLELVTIRAVNHPESATELDKPTLDFILGCNTKVVLQHVGGRP
jgi:hypothetical protein